MIITYALTPGVYDIPKSLRPGKYVVTAIRDAGLHMKDSLGRVKDYYETKKLLTSAMVVY